MGFAPGPGQGGSSSIAGSSDVALNSLQNNQVLTYDSNSTKWQNQSARAGGSETLSYTGPLVTGNGVVPIYNDSGYARTITNVRASVGSPSAGASIIIDVNVANTTIFPTQSQRPSIAASQTTSGAVIRSVAWPNGAALTVDVDQVGSTVAGQDLVVTIGYR